MNFNFGGDVPYNKFYELLKERSLTSSEDYVDLIEFRKICANTPGVRLGEGDSFFGAIEKAVDWGWFKFSPDGKGIRLAS